MATDTRSLMTSATITPIDFSQLLASLTANALNRGQDTTTPTNAVVQPIAASGTSIPAVTGSSGPVVNPNAALPPVTPTMPAGNAVALPQKKSKIAPQGDTSFTDQILAQNQAVPIVRGQAPAAGGNGTDIMGVIDHVAHLADKGEGILKFIAAL